MQMILVHVSGMMVLLVEKVPPLLGVKQGTVLHHGVSWLLSLVRQGLSLWLQCKSSVWPICSSFCTSHD